MPEPRTLAQPSARFAGDDGAPDPLVRRAIAQAVGPLKPRGVHTAGFYAEAA